MLLSHISSFLAYQPVILLTHPPRLLRIFFFTITGPHWSPCCYLSTPDLLFAENLCIYSSLCLECDSPRCPQDSIPHLLQVFTQMSPCQGALLWLSHWNNNTPSLACFLFLYSIYPLPDRLHILLIFLCISAFPNYNAVWKQELSLLFPRLEEHQDPTVGTQ